ncbi:hypothetical protein LCGC14_1390260 [marine sediment metagenome]|uniref:Uncharacterized protein n=1 Tax=marine sediment metagenome TaxID=412755 RepID=A0A0F9K0D5_9ZZZZ
MVISIDKKSETEYYSLMYTGETRNLYIFKDIRNKRFYKFLKIALGVIGTIVSALVALATI